MRPWYLVLQNAGENDQRNYYFKCVHIAHCWVVGDNTRYFLET